MTNSKKISLQPKREFIPPGFLVYFIPENYDKLPERLLNALVDNPRGYDVEIRKTPNAKIYFKAAIKIPCLSDFNESKIWVISIDSNKTDYRRAVNKLFSRDWDIVKIPSKRVEYIPQSTIANPSSDNDHCYACNTPFIGKEDWDNPDEEEENEIDEQQDEYMEQLISLTHEFATKFHKLPSFDTIVKTVTDRLALPSRSDNISPITISPDYRIYLDNYSIELRLPPIIKSLYILFLNHSEGIKLKEIYDYRHELLMIYSIVKRHAEITSDDRTHIDRLVDPFDSSSLNQKISKCRQLIEAHILNPESAKAYYIDGYRSEQYRILASSGQISLPPSLQRIYNNITTYKSPPKEF